jgi:hypothetical protein
MYRFCGGHGSQFSPMFSVFLHVEGFWEVGKVFGSLYYIISCFGSFQWVVCVIN